MKTKFEHYWLCHSCATEQGGVWPENHCCTVIHGKCPYCGKEDTIIPYVDFNWPKDKETDKIAKQNRD